MIAKDKRYFGGVIWTNHALARLNERGITQATALTTLLQPQRSRWAADKQAWIYNRTFSGQAVEVVATQNELKQWVVVSVWSRPASQLHNRYLVRNGVVDWLLDKLFGSKK